MPTDLPLTPTAKTLKRIRNELCLEQSELARLFCISVIAVWRYENGQRVPRKSTIRMMVDILKKKNVKVSFKDFLE